VTRLADIAQQALHHPYLPDQLLHGTVLSPRDRELWMAIGVLGVGLGRVVSRAVEVYRRRSVCATVHLLPMAEDLVRVVHQNQEDVAPIGVQR